MFLFSWQSRAFSLKEKWCRRSTSPLSISLLGPFQRGGKGFTLFHLTAFWFHLSFIPPRDKMESKMMSLFFLFPSLFSHQDSLLCFRLSLPPSPFLHPIFSAVTPLHIFLFSVPPPHVCSSAVAAPISASTRQNQVAWRKTERIVWRRCILLKREDRWKMRSYPPFFLTHWITKCLRGVVGD